MFVEKIFCQPLLPRLPLLTRATTNLPMEAFKKCMIYIGLHTKRGEMYRECFGVYRKAQIYFKGQINDIDAIFGKAKISGLRLPIKISLKKHLKSFVICVNLYLLTYVFDF